MIIHPPVARPVRSYWCTGTIAGLIYRCGSAYEANTDQCDSSKLQPQPHSCHARPCAAQRWIARGRGDAPHQSRLALDDHRSSTGRATLARARRRGRRPQLRRASGLRDADPPRARVEGG